MMGEMSRFSTMGKIPFNLLKSLLRGSMDDILVDRLSGWLVVASQPDLIGLRFRLEYHRDKLKELIAYGVERCACAEDITSCMRSMERVLFGARPFDFGPWCLDRALSATTERAASIYVWLLAESLMQRHHAAGLTLEEARERLIAQPLLVELFDERIEQADDPHADASSSSALAGSRTPRRR